MPAAPSMRADAGDIPYASVVSALPVRTGSGVPGTHSSGSAPGPQLVPPASVHPVTQGTSPSDHAGASGLRRTVPPASRPSVAAWTAVHSPSSTPRAPSVAIIATAMAPGTSRAWVRRVARGAASRVSIGAPSR
jgi:hypothetical protein